MHSQIIMTRTEALEAYCTILAKQLTEADIQSIAVDWTQAGAITLDEAEKELRSEGIEDPSPELIEWLASGDQCPSPTPSFMRPVLLSSLMKSHAQVQNSYIESELGKTIEGVKVEGEDAVGSLCPCCGYYSLDAEDPGWDICLVCFWENGGDGPNHMTLAEAQKNFATFGAMSEGHLTHVDPLGPQKYRRSPDFT